MSIIVAKNCFAENRNLFGDAKTQPEKFNLYSGLANLADAVQKLERTIDDIQRTVKHLESKIK